MDSARYSAERARGTSLQRPPLRTARRPRADL